MAIYNDSKTAYLQLTEEGTLEWVSIPPRMKECADVISELILKTGLTKPSFERAQEIFLVASDILRGRD